eukprot:m.176453 g.176453  ORF g.176453 m.176453 type:complete len:332 (+) comp24442_c0_seq4:30-1025(+)
MNDLGQVQVSSSNQLKSVWTWCLSVQQYVAISTAPNLLPCHGHVLAWKWRVRGIGRPVLPARPDRERTVATSLILDVPHPRQPHTQHGLLASNRIHQRRRVHLGGHPLLEEEEHPDNDEQQRHCKGCLDGRWQVRQRKVWRNRLHRCRDGHRPLPDEVAADCEHESGQHGVDLQLEDPQHCRYRRRLPGWASPVLCAAERIRLAVVPTVVIGRLRVLRWLRWLGRPPWLGPSHVMVWHVIVRHRTGGPHHPRVRFWASSTTGRGDLVVVRWTGWLWVAETGRTVGVARGRRHIHVPSLAHGVASTVGCLFAVLFRSLVRDSKLRVSHGSFS